MYDSKLEEIVRGDYTIEIHADYDCPFDPMEEDLFTTFVCWHNHYSLGNAITSPRDKFVKGKQVFYTPEDFMDYVKEENPPIVMNLYMYDHSGIGISVDNSRYPYNCPWDSGQVGYVFVTRKKILETYGGKYITIDKLEKARKLMLEEVKYYNSYLAGEIYGYRIIDLSGEEVDSCWGFIGDYKYMLEEVYSIVDSLQIELDKEKIALTSLSRGEVELCLSLPG